MKPAKRKLTACDVQMIREAVTLRDTLRERASRLSNAALAKRFGVHECTVEKVISGNTWGWLE